VAATISVVITLASLASRFAGVPADRTTYYDRVWAIDPVAQTMMESEWLLLDDDCVDPRHRRLYPLLGPAQRRRVARIACGASTERVEARLKEYRMQTVYAIAYASGIDALDERYPADRFELIHRSTTGGDGVRPLIERRIYHWRAATGSDPGT
jgi:hypothetical protein